MLTSLRFFISHGASSRKRSRETEEEEESVTDEVLDALPELRSSRLVDDHCGSAFLLLGGN